MALVGVGYRHVLAPWIDRSPPEIECLEVTAQHFYGGGLSRLEELARRYPLMVHALGCSLGTPGPLDRAELSRLAEVVAVAKPLWISDHLGFVRTTEADLGHFNPLLPNSRNADIVAEHAAELAAALGVPVILENITTHIRLSGPLSEPAFLNRICKQADCGVLLDVTNLFVNSRNHGFDARAWLMELDPQYVTQLHVVGCSYHGGRWHDAHCEAIQDSLWELIELTAAHTQPRTVIIERDDNFPPAREFTGELHRLKRLFNSKLCTEKLTQALGQEAR